MNKYGIQWDDRLTDADIELACYLLKWPKEQGGLGAAQHLCNALALLFPPPLYVFHPWTLPRAEAFCECPYDIWWGPGSTGKSTDAAAFFLLDWIAAPHLTRTVLCSTTKPMLMDRIWGEVLRLYLSREDLPGKYLKSETKIVLNEENPKACIVGIAILLGTKSEALGNIIGAHMPRNRLCVDEMPHARQAAEDAITNMESSGEFKFLGMGNPISRYDLMGRNSEPLEGWESISEATEKWRTKKGWVHFWSGNRCPGVLDPEGAKKWPFLLSRAKMEDTKEKHGEKSLQYQSQRVGFISSEGVGGTVLSEAEVERGRARDGVVWRSISLTVAGLDLAYTSAGDDCILQIVDAGYDTTGEFRLFFRPQIKIEIRDDRTLPVGLQIGNQVSRHLRANGILLADLSVDTTTVQRILADEIERVYGQTGLYRVGFEEKPLERPASDGDATPSARVYANRVTQIWFQFAEFVRAGRVRGLSIEAARQFCARKVKERHPARLESKKDMAERGMKSPNDADASALATCSICELHGILAAFKSLPDPGSLVQPQEPVVDTEQPPEPYSTPVENAYGTP